MVLSLEKTLTSYEGVQDELVTTYDNDSTTSSPFPSRVTFTALEGGRKMIYK